MSSTLLLLPPIPFPPTYPSLKAAYHAPLLTLLRTLSQFHTSPAPLSPSQDVQRPTLDIAVPIPLLYKYQDAPRAALFHVAQKTLAGVYKLIAIISAREGLNVEGDEGVDVRILLLAWPRDGLIEEHGKDSDSEDARSDVVVSIQSLVKAVGRWNEVLGVESEEGEQLLKMFVRLGGSRGDVQVRKVRGGIVHVDSAKEDSFVVEHSEGKSKRHYSVANGGTFDHLHIGHKLLLSMTAFILDTSPGNAALDERKSYITIGITAEDLLKNKKYAEFLESWTERQRVVHRFLRGVMCFDEPGKEFEETNERNDPGPNGHIVEVRIPGGIAIAYTEIWDPFGPTITDESISALVLSEETRKGGQAVNDKRKEVGFEPLDVFEVDVLDAEEDGEQRSMRAGVEKQFLSKLSSTEIRKARSERSHGKSKV